MRNLFMIVYLRLQRTSYILLFLCSCFLLMLCFANSVTTNMDNNNNNNNNNNNENNNDNKVIGIELSFHDATLGVYLSSIKLWVLLIFLQKQNRQIFKCLFKSIFLQKNILFANNASKHKMHLSEVKIKSANLNFVKIRVRGRSK